LALAAAASCGGGGGGNSVGNQPPAALNISTPALATGFIDVPYNQTIAATGGSGARTFTLEDGALPEGLALASANGVISGTPTGATGTTEFSISVADSGSPQQTDTQALSITINAAVAGRNDSIANATPIGNGTYAASISPSGHPNSQFAPDEDFYAITTTAASTVTVDIDAEVNGSPLDSVIEIVGSNGAPLQTCIAPAFSSTCINDDEGEVGIDVDSFLEIEVGGATTFFIHVVDWSGNARPDMLYDLNVSGVE
jgi:Putative Ig domain